MSEIQTTALTIAGDFAVCRTSKSGKETYRTALGVVSSGNAAERAQLTLVAAGTMIANNNFRGLAREVFRVFPVSLLKSQCIEIGEVPHLVVSVNEKPIALDVNAANKRMMHAYAEGILRKLQLAGKELKGEKKLYAQLLANMLEGERLRLAAQAEAEAIEVAAQTVDAE